jgi:ABC-2 type transport system ATP-binding protein
VNTTIAQHDDDLIINTNGLTKAFGNTVAVEDLNLQVMRGDVFGFLGPNGAGKTTTIRMLLGLMRPTRGQVNMFGMDNAHHLPAILQRTGAIVETPTFYSYLSGRDNLRVIAAASGMDAGAETDKRIAEVLEIVDLHTYGKLAYRKYSLGMKQRLGIAAALLADPELVMLDEPTNGLDPAGVVEMREFIQRLASLSKTVFLSGHILYEIQQVCNRVAILRKGQLIRQGRVDELLQVHERVEVRFSKEDDTLAAQNILQQAQSQGADWIRGVKPKCNRQNQLLLFIEAPIARAGEINALLMRQNMFATELHPHEGSLEEVFLQLTATQTNERK